MSTLRNIVLPDKGPKERFDIQLAADGTIESMTPTDRHNTTPSPTPPGLLLEPLCHPHIHLDKPYILTCNKPRYADLEPKTGTFEEALENTSKAKSRYTTQDLYLRGAQLLVTSYNQGVTSLRAFVEVDHVTGTLPLRVAIQLKRDFGHLIYVQICAFAQDPLFSAPHGPANWKALESALVDHGKDIDVLGTAPYVESSRQASEANIMWAVSTALEHDLHLDFHLDYDLEEISPDAFFVPQTQSPVVPLTASVLHCLEVKGWPKKDASAYYDPHAKNPPRTVVLGHCTRLTVLSRGGLARLGQIIHASRLPVYFVGLPTSDLLTQGRPSSRDFASLGVCPHDVPRGTLQVVSLIRDFGMRACLSVNNVGNAFAPAGTGDPLALACNGVGLYHAGTVADAELLYECVSRRAREAIGLDGPDVGPVVARRLLVKNRRAMEVPMANAEGERDEETVMRIPARQRLTIRDVVWDPPEVELRKLVP